MECQEWFETFLGQLDAHFARHAFLLGGRPTLGDFGLMGPLYAHISRDPYPGRLLRAKAPHVVQWLERMQFNQSSAHDMTRHTTHDTHDKRTRLYR